MTHRRDGNTAPDKPDSARDLRGFSILALFDALPDEVLVVDAEGVIMGINAEGAKTLGGDSADLVGEILYDHVPLGIAKARKAFITGALESRTSLRFEEKHSGRWVENVVTAMPALAGASPLVLFISRDISPQKKFEEKARQCERQLGRAARMISLGTLVSGVAHEINNPANFIKMNSTILNDAWKSALPILDDYCRENGDVDVGGLPYSEMRRSVPVLFEGVNEGIQRIEAIISSLKNFGNPDISESWEELSINSVVEGAISLLDHFTKRHTENFHAELGEGLPKIVGNPQKLEQVVINLLQNACQALPEKGRAVTLSTAFDGPGEALVLKVSDEGAGISPGAISRIMDPFYTSRRSSGGTGLGLSIVLKIVKEHGGDITFSSVPGEGTDCKVVLPVRNIVPTTKILIVDDDAPMRRLMRRILSRDRRYVVNEASNGVEACIKLGSFRPHLLLLDINMPEMDGLEVCRWIRAEPALASMKVVIITGHPGSSLFKEVKGLGFETCLVKPFKSLELTETLRKMLRQ